MGKWTQNDTTIENSIFRLNNDSIGLIKFSQDLVIESEEEFDRTVILIISLKKAIQKFKEAKRYLETANFFFKENN